MAIAFDAASTSIAMSWSHTCSGADRVLFICFTVPGLGASTFTATYNGVSMTSITGITFGADGSNGLFAFYLGNPALGSNTITVTRSGGFNDLAQACAASYTGANVVGIPDSFATNTGTGATVVGTTTTIKDNCWSVLMGGGNNTGTATITVGAGGTNRANTGTAGDVWASCIGDTNAAVTPPGSSAITMNRSSGGVGSQGGGVIIASFIPLQTGKPSDFYLLF